MNLTNEDLELWRAHPVTEYLLGFSRRQAQRVKAEILEDMWRTGEFPSLRVEHCKAVERLVDDFENATAEDLAALEESMND